MDRSYIPGKPHPNCFEFFGACDGFMYHILWDKPHFDAKYARPTSMKDLVLKFVDIFDQCQKDHKTKRQPFTFYLDARFSSLDLIRELHKRGYKAVMSMSSTAAPQPLWPYMKEGLQKREWRVAYLPKIGSSLTTVRAKKRAYVHLVSNRWSARPITVVHRRSKPPTGSFSIHCPEVQKRYNLGKNKVDVWNSHVLRYRAQARYNSSGEAYFNFFLQALTTNAYIWWKARQNKKVDQLAFRVKLLRQSFKRLGLHKKASSPHPAHWPGPLSQSGKCQMKSCRNHARSTCRKCNLNLCSACMEEVHKSLWN